MNFTAVIGAGYGDEGKGRIVDYLASQDPDALVVRFNGGGQAGHRVVVDDKDHVFSHFGSGTLSGNPTYFSEHCVVNPMVFNKEAEDLRKIGLDPIDKVAFHPNCEVTLPYDVLINQELERKRGRARHGSCGLGFGQTITRKKDFYSFTMADLVEGDYHAIERLLPYYKQKFTDLNIYNPDDAIWNREFIREYLIDSEFDKFNSTIQYNTGYSLLKEYNSVIFEGAQGLELDQESENFPYVTRSNTGIKNVIDIIGSDKELDVLYITRTYKTRHGAGPLEFEDHYKMDSTRKVTLVDNDEKNVMNEHQGAFRYAPLSLYHLKRAVYEDLKSVRVWKRGVVQIAVTCVDQVTSELPYYTTEKGNGKGISNLLLELDPKIICSGKDRKNTADLR